jgi:hypothetical protein
VKQTSLPYLICAFALCFIFNSCRTTKTVNAEKVRLMGAGKLYSLVTSNYLPFNKLSVKFDVSINLDSVTHSVNGTLRIRKDSLIWISIAPLGIDAFKIQFTPDSIMFLNILKKEYFVNSYEYFENKFQTELSFNDLQSIFTNEVFLYSDTDEENNEKYNTDSQEREYFRKTFIPATDSNMYVLKTHRKHKIKKYIKKNKTSDLIVETLRILPEVFKVEQVTVKDFNEKRNLLITYSDFINVNSKTFPSNIKIELNTAEKNMNAEIKYNKVTVDSDISFPFKITDKYKRIN